MCNCIDRVNKGIKVYNSELHIPETINFNTGECGSANRVMIMADRIGAKKYGTGRNLLATYCPFCGEKYPTITPEQVEDAIDAVVIPEVKS
jgi:hypothetical protein